MKETLNQTATPSTQKEMNIFDKTSSIKSFGVRYSRNMENMGDLIHHNYLTNFIEQAKTKDQKY